MAEYNELTKRLIREGYSAEKHPDYVRVCNSRLPGDDPLNNLDGGFIYTRGTIDKFVYKTRCGKFIKGSGTLHDNLFWQGVCWSHENNNPLLVCPYHNRECEHNIGCSGAGGGFTVCCSCQRTQEPYSYQKSIEHDRETQRWHEKKLYHEFARKLHGRACPWHCHYDREKDKWRMRYNPCDCARVGCMLRTGNRFCPVLRKKLDSKKGNVYYDLEIRRERTELRGTFFEGQVETKVHKAKRFLDKKASFTICEAIAKRRKKAVLEKEKGYYSQEIFFNNYHNILFKLNVHNIHAASKASRDLEQDLADLAEGKKVYFEADLEKEAAESKKKRREEAREKKIRKLEEKIIKAGYTSLPDHSLDKIHADKWLGEERIAELKRKRERMQEEAMKEPVQMNIFDFMNRKEG